MTTKIPIQRDEWIEKLEAICARRILSGRELAREIGIHYNTLVVFMDRDDLTVCNPKTIRTIDKYIKHNER
jgi:DNA-binding Xre family transcriptional regulator